MNQVQSSQYQTPQHKPSSKFPILVFVSWVSRERMSILIFLLLCITTPTLTTQNEHNHNHQEQDSFLSSSKSNGRSRVIDMKGGPESVIWVVQISDLHFSVHNPDRAFDFKTIVGPTLSMINPSLVLITGDLTDGKSKDLLTMKQNEEEWVEYQNVMDDVITRSRLDKSIFYDIRGNHDNFGVPVVDSSFDFFSKYSINGQLGRKKNVNSITIQTDERKHLFVGFDSTMSVGLRGPTNLFGHPTDQLLTELDSELSQWNSQEKERVTKISFGHFPISFSASSHSGRSLKDIFLKHSLSAYLCGHLHRRFGKNLKRHYHLNHNILSSQKFFQLDMHQTSLGSNKNCSSRAPPIEEFWEWEMADWRKSRAMRILAIDRGHVSYVDINVRTGSKKTIILPTFPVDSRFISQSSLHQYECQHMVPQSYETIRALVFSVSPISSVVAKVYDSRSGNLDMVLEELMRKHVDNSSRGSLYAAPWYYKAFEDSSPNRFWLQIEVTDVKGRTTLSELRPFSVNGLTAKVSWTWKEFFVMGCQWATLYYPILWSALYFLFFILLVPKALLVFSKKQYTYKNFVAKRGFINGIAWVLQELCKITIVWFGILGYLFYLILFPWFVGEIFTDGGDKGYMTYMGWVVKTSNNKERHEYVGSPDVMVLVLPHLIFLVLPATLVSGALAAEREVYREHVLSLSGKKEDDHVQNNEGAQTYDHQGNRRTKFCLKKRWIRKILLVICFALFWKHLMDCRSLVKAYEMNPILHFPIYSLSIPLLLVYTVYKTGKV